MDQEAGVDFGPGKACRLPSIPNEGPSNVVVHRASYTITQFGRQKSIFPARKNTVAAGVSIGGGLPCYVPSIADPMESVSCPHRLERSQASHRGSSSGISAIPSAFLIPSVATDER